MKAIQKWYNSPIVNRGPAFFFLLYILALGAMLKITSCSKIAARVPAIQSAFQVTERGKGDKTKVPSMPD